MDSGLMELVRESIASYCNVSVNQLENLRVEKVYDADRQIFRLTPEVGPEIFALKIRGPSAEKQADLDDCATENEYKKIERAYSVVEKAGGGIDMPAPVGFFSSHRAILTTWCDGRELRSLFYRNAWRWPFSAGELRNQFRHCGVWLGQFHNVSRHFVSSAESTQNRLNHLERMLGEVSHSPRNLLSANDLLCLGAVIRDRLLMSDCTEYGLLHGNFTLRNILVSQNRAVPVDFEDSREDSIYMDVGQFLADTMLSAYRPFTWVIARRSVTAAFIGAYGKYVPVDAEQIKGYVSYHLLATYYEVVGRNVHDRKGLLIASHQAKVFAKMLCEPVEKWL
jgi:hypothetical protein